MPTPNSFLFTSESVTEGHPDKMCDLVSDSILDALLKQDRNSRAGLETLMSTGLVVLAGETRSSARVDFQELVRETIIKIGYDNSEKGFDAGTCSVLNAINKQSTDIALGVDAGTGLHKEQGAGDQGLMFGYATDETDVLMPMPAHLAHRMSERLTRVRKNGELPYLRPDGKTQVTLQYENGKPAKVKTVVISSQHEENIEHGRIREELIEKVGKKVIPETLLNDDIVWHVNPTGKFVIGGPMGDCGLTGRKIIVDTYGGMGRHGGGAFSGKDPSKVDRSAAYAARYIAKNIVAAGLAGECEVQFSYAIGFSRPLSVNVNTFGTEKADLSRLTDFIGERYPLTPEWIIEKLDLLRPIYSQTSVYGHFGRNLPDFTWERTDLAEELKSEFLR